ESLIDSMSKNKVIAELHGKDISYWQASAFVSELEQFLGGRHINQSMVGFLTAIWDRNIFKERTRRGGEVIIHNPYFSMVGCCTPNWMNDKLKQDVVSDGFTRRTIFCLEHELACMNPWPKSKPNHFEMLSRLTAEAQRIFQVRGGFDVTKEAFDLFCNRYLHMRDEAKNFSPKLENYFSSKHILVLKTAICLSAGVDSSRLIDSTIMSTAFKFLDYTERNLDNIFSGVGRNELKAYADEVLRQLNKNPGQTKADLMRLSFDNLKSVEFDEIIEYLTKTNQITVQPGQTVQVLPVFRATEVKKLLPAENLLELASQLRPSQERKMEDSAAFEVARHLAPATVQHLTDLAERKART